MNISQHDKWDMTYLFMVFITSLIVDFRDHSLFSSDIAFFPVFIYVILGEFLNYFKITDKLLIQELGNDIIFNAHHFNWLVFLWLVAIIGTCNSAYILIWWILHVIFIVETYIARVLFVSECPYKIMWIVLFWGFRKLPCMLRFLELVLKRKFVTQQEDCGLAA